MAKKNYKILKNDTFGRYMAASKNIKAGELILTEKPTLVGPALDGPLICFGCCRSVRNTGYIFCKNCNKAIICTPKCSGSLHNAEECSALQEINISGEIFTQYDQIVYPIRCILFKKYNTDTWDSFTKLEPHLESRRDTHIWRRHKVTVEEILREINFLSEEDLKDELVQKVCGILDVNTFEVRSPKCSTEVVLNPAVQCLRGLYLEAALMAHDCVGNTHLSVDDEFVLTVHASVDIPEDSTIFFNYTNALQGTVERKQFLREGKYFECSCERCKDATELGTNLSSLKCHICRRGLIRMLDPHKIKSDWECSECKKKFCSSLIRSTVEEARRLIQEVDHSNINDMENIFKKLLNSFHSNHYLLLELQQNLAGLYSWLPPNKTNLPKKIILCQGLLDVFSKLEPGLSRMKALTLYELQSATVDLAHKQYKDKEIPLDELIVKLLSSENYLKEAIKHLLYEPKKSPEGKVAQRAMLELKLLRKSITSGQNDLLSANIKVSNASEKKLGAEKKSDGNTNIRKGKVVKDFNQNTLGDSSCSGRKSNKPRKKK